MVVSSERAPTPFVEQGQAVFLEVVVYKPPGSGPFPTVVFNHGSTGLGNDPALFMITYLRSRADVDPTRMLSGGISRGGILAVVHAARRPDVYRGAFNFVGGWLGEGCVDAALVNRSTFVRGATFPIDSFWMYGENDSFYSITHSRANFDAFAAAGGPAAFKVYQRAPGADGHFIIDDPALWAADLDRYVREHQ